MKKALKMLTVALLSVAMLFAFAQPISLAAHPTANDVIGGIENTSTNTNMTEANKVTANIINWIWGISIIIAIVVLMVIGIKFIIGGTQEKAEYKKSLLPVVVGVILVVFATTIVKILFGMNGQ